jgi:hypothetical protein
MRIASRNITHMPERGSRAFEPVIQFPRPELVETIGLGSRIINKFGDRGALEGIVRDPAHREASVITRPQTAQPRSATRN